MRDLMRFDPRPGRRMMRDGGSWGFAVIIRYGIETFFLFFAIE
jgi:hypothetical protein